LIIHQHFDKAFAWSTDGNAISFKPEDLIDSSIVILGLLSIKGDLLWDTKYGNYSAEEFGSTINRFFKAMNSSKKGLLVLSKLPYR
jgi:hypothetical protein